MKQLKLELVRGDETTRFAHSALSNVKRAAACLPAAVPQKSLNGALGRPAPTQQQLQNFADFVTVGMGDHAICVVANPDADFEVRVERGCVVSFKPVDMKVLITIFRPPPGLYVPPCAPELRKGEATVCVRKGSMQSSAGSLYPAVTTEGMEEVIESALQNVSERTAASAIRHALHTRFPGSWHVVHDRARTFSVSSPGSPFVEVTLQSGVRLVAFQAQGRADTLFWRRMTDWLIARRAVIALYTFLGVLFWAKLNYCNNPDDSMGAFPFLEDTDNCDVVAIILPFLAGILLFSQLAKRLLPRLRRR